MWADYGLYACRGYQPAVESPAVDQADDVGAVRDVSESFERRNRPAVSEALDVDFEIAGYAVRLTPKVFDFSIRFFENGFFMRAHDEIRIYAPESLYRGHFGFEAVGYEADVCDRGSSVAASVRGESDSSVKL